MYRSIICALLALVMILSFSACGSSTGDEREQASTVPTETAGEVFSTPSDETAAEPSAISIPPSPYDGRSDLVILNWAAYENRPHEIQPGTVLNYATPYNVSSQLPWICISEGWLTGNIYEGLLYMYMNDPEDIRGCIAESWSHSDDYLTWTFQIRDGVMFADGTVCDADAIATAWDYVQAFSPGVFSNCNIESWEAASAKELVVRLSAPCGWFEVALCGEYYFLIVSPTALDLYGTDDNQAAIGTGPYCIASYTSGERIVLKANSDYYLEEKKPCIETVNFQIIQEQDNVLSALLSGDVDGANVSDLESYRLLESGGYGGTIAACFGDVNSIWLNAKNFPAFKTFAVREAICRLIDFSAINNDLYDGMGAVQDSIWAKGSSSYVPTDQFYYDPDAGLKLLASVGVEASDIELEITIVEAQEALATAIQSELRKSGVKLTLNILYPWNPTTQKKWSLYIGYMGYRSTAPYYPWQYILKQNTVIKTCFQDIYDPALYEKMLKEYDSIFAAKTWDVIVSHCKQLTVYEQDDFGAVGGIQPPEFVALSKDFKNGIYFSEDHDLQLYYLYQ